MENSKNKIKILENEIRKIKKKTYFELLKDREIRRLKYRVKRLEEYIKRINKRHKN